MRLLFGVLELFDTLRPCTQLTSAKFYMLGSKVFEPPLESKQPVQVFFKGQVILNNMRGFQLFLTAIQVIS
jgi:hypothetical protein